VRYSEPEGTGEDVAIAYFRVLSRHLPAGNENKGHFSKSSVSTKMQTGYLANTY
jgi:hypothetical protein